jgi:hypothetical protein
MDLEEKGRKIVHWLYLAEGSENCPGSFKNVNGS